MLAKGLLHTGVGTPLDDGGASVTAYVIEKREFAHAHWMRVARVKVNSGFYCFYVFMYHYEITYSG